MIDTMNEVTLVSPLGGKLFLEKVEGNVAAQNTPENNIEVAAGGNRTMYVYAPASGCFDPKQTQVLMILRDEADEESAARVMASYGLDKLAEEKHLILLFPNPTELGWNYAEKENLENDMDFLKRCFVSLALGKAGVAGFNGMIFYLATSESASAMIFTLASLSPVDAAGIMISDVPSDYRIPSGALYAPQVAYINSENNLAEAYLRKSNGICGMNSIEGGRLAYSNSNNECIRHVVSRKETDQEEVWFAWEYLFSETRRWRNDTFGTYQRRTNFSERGFEQHVDAALPGLTDDSTHTWYEYVPPQLRGSHEKVPLVIYFHGIGCVPLYGAEQSGWHDIADRDNFIVVYPQPSIEKRWNVWDDDRLPSDLAFIFALMKYLEGKYAIDPTRIYLSGFSMGSMMTNALAAAYPEKFAAAAPCNAPHLGYLSTLSGMAPLIMKLNPKSNIRNLTLEPEGKESAVKRLADSKKQAFDYRMPVIQNIGLLDLEWSLTDPDGPWRKTFDYWMDYNGIADQEFEAESPYESGLIADENMYEGLDQRFLHHKWHSEDFPGKPLYELIYAKRMPHAVDLRQIELAWEFMKQFARNGDGSLVLVDEVQRINV
ncbi:MAG: PHB depolymerase family esterase [Trichococcus sp.]|uniref:alpha/beta hydrolase family esterase n=1 Tax=Trichococcus sp. TaxID=1985464 RepID=UPI003C52CCAD